MWWATPRQNNAPRTCRHALFNEDPLSQSFLPFSRSLPMPPQRVLFNAESESVVEIQSPTGKSEEGAAARDANIRVIMIQPHAMHRPCTPENLALVANPKAPPTWAPMTVSPAAPLPGCNPLALDASIAVAFQIAVDPAGLDASGKSSYRSMILA